MHSEYFNKSDDSILFQDSGFDDSIRVKLADGMVGLSSFPPILRTLLVTDGTVTKTLESWAWEPICIDTVNQKTIYPEQPIDWLNTQRNEDLVERTVVLRGKRSGACYASAYSILRLSQLPERLASNLERGRIGIGALIRQLGVGSFREVLEVGTTIRGESASQPDHLYRTYRILIENIPAMLITEYFPLDLYSARVLPKRSAPHE